MEVEFKEDQILFPKGYYYKYSNIKSGKALSAKHLTEVNLNTFPPSFVINDNEVIFIPYKLKLELEEFGRKNQIPIVDRFDIWAAINEPFLDTEFEEIYKEKTINNLLKNGVSEEEVSQIRAKIKSTMLSGNALVWEWVNLGQSDYLDWVFLTKEKYWWSMEIALRNY